jgi:hypothetical protein
VFFASGQPLWLSRQPRQAISATCTRSSAANLCAVVPVAESEPWSASINSYRITASRSIPHDDPGLTFPVHGAASAAERPRGPSTRAVLLVSAEHAAHFPPTVPAVAQRECSPRAIPSSSRLPRHMRHPSYSPPLQFQGGNQSTYPGVPLRFSSPRGCLSSRPVPSISLPKDWPDF